MEEATKDAEPVVKQAVGSAETGHVIAEPVVSAMEEPTP